MIVFGDTDPEDAWDDGDPLVIRLTLLARILAHIYAEAAAGNLERAEARKADLRRPAVRVITELIAVLDLPDLEP